MRRIALTGGIATGKSHVRARFEGLGVPTIDADTLARDIVAPGTEALAAIVQRFGADVLDPSGALDRRRLGAIVFEHDGERRALEAIIHPGIRRAMNAWFDTLPSTHAFAIADIPLLYETGRAHEFDAVIVTACAPETQVKRVMARDRLTETEARQRIAAQMPIDEKVKRADYVIRTEGSFEETDAQVDRVHHELNGPVP
jgi:dephospho-CoA kinase